MNQPKSSSRINIYANGVFLIAFVMHIFYGISHRREANIFNALATPEFYRNFAIYIFFVGVVLFLISIIQVKVSLITITFLLIDLSIVFLRF